MNKLVQPVAMIGMVARVWHRHLSIFTRTTGAPALALTVGFLATIFVGPARAMSRLGYASDAHQVIILHGAQVIHESDDARSHVLALGALFDGKAGVILLDDRTYRVIARRILSTVNSMADFTFDDARHLVWGTTDRYIYGALNLWAIDTRTGAVVRHITPASADPRTAKTAAKWFIGSFAVDTHNGGVAVILVELVYGKEYAGIDSRDDTAKPVSVSYDDSIQCIDPVSHHTVIYRHGFDTPSPTYEAVDFARGNLIWSRSFNYSPEDAECDPVTGRLLILQPGGGIGSLNITSNTFLSHVGPPLNVNARPVNDFDNEPSQALLLDPATQTALSYGNYQATFVRFGSHTDLPIGPKNSEFVSAWWGSGAPLAYVNITLYKENTYGDLEVSGTRIGVVDMRTGRIVGMYGDPTPQGDTDLYIDSNGVYVDSAHTFTDQNTGAQTTTHDFVRISYR